MLLRLDDAERLASQLGFPTTRTHEGQLSIEVCPAVKLLYINWTDSSDSLIGFGGAASHSHGSMSYEAGAGSYVECDELEVLVALSVGDLVIVSEYAHGELRDRRLHHRLQPLNLKYVEPGTHLEVRTAASTKRDPSVRSERD